MTGSVHTLEVRPVVPAAIGRLHDLAGNLLYSWDRNIRRLFFRLDADLWAACRHNPKLVLRRVAQSRLDEAAQDPDFLSNYREALSRFDAYMAARPDPPPSQDAPHVAYFCMEFGIHESVGLYSGGLGILAGDYCKAASYGDVPFTAIGLMYRQGYFAQTIDSDGSQQAHALATDPDDLPVQLVTGDDGQALTVAVAFPGRMVHMRIWRADVGRVALYLLDTDTAENSPADRGITYQLYGGDRHTRIAQELVLGIGGVRALRALGLEPQVWHVNEGHPAFLIFELCRETMADGLEFHAAMERVAGSVVFTTHTPVHAGHDRFDPELASAHLEPLAAEIGVPVEQLLVLGMSAQDHRQFNMTTLALRGSRHCNGVSRIHGGVASRMAAHIWPDIEPDENPMQYVTNGVHVPTFLAREWSVLLTQQHSSWRSRFCECHEFWRELVEGIPDHRFWSLRQSLKSAMLVYVARSLQRQYERMDVSHGRIEAMHRALDANEPWPLVIGFARRITAYKRPLLLFRDRARLERLLLDPERPVLLIFAGKAHPQDGEGQSMIRTINELASQPPFRNRLFFVEDYNIALARKLVTGVDVWLNTPDYPQEASGTSGQKAAINGVINLSVLDGWWAEAYNGSNGWAIAPHDRRLAPHLRDDLEADDLFSLIENEVLPDFFRRDASGIPEAWIRRAKASMATVMPRYNADRMLADYMKQCYLPAARLAHRLAADGCALARELSAWKARIADAWGHVALRWAEAPVAHARSGTTVPLRVAARMAGLAAAEVKVECVVAANHVHGLRTFCLPFVAESVVGDEQIYCLDLVPPIEGVLELRVRAYPNHAGLAHPFSTGHMVWLG
jgi:glycogen phosphorylase